MAEVAVIGVGRMGAAVVARLVAAGHVVTGCDVRSSRRAAVESLGARWTCEVADAASSADYALTLLPGTAELKELVLTADGLLPHLRADATWIDLTSTSDLVSRACAERARSRRIASLDAPIGGGVNAVRSGAAVLYVGGRAAVLDDARGLLACFAATVLHMGQRGTGHLAKLLINLLWFGQVGLVTEALLLAQRLDLSPVRLAAALPGSAGESAFSAHHLPALLQGDYLADFGLDRCVEELASVHAAAVSAGLPHELISAVTELHRSALHRYGRVDGELLAAAWLEERAGSRLARPPADRPDL